MKTSSPALARRPRTRWRAPRPPNARCKLTQTHLDVLTAPDSTRVALAGQPAAPGRPAARTGAARAAWPCRSRTCRRCSRAAPTRCGCSRRACRSAPGLLTPDAAGRSTVVYSVPPGDVAADGNRPDGRAGGGVPQPTGQLVLVGLLARGRVAPASLRMRDDHLLQLLFTQSLDGFFFMMLDEPIEWSDQADKERLLDYVFAHQRVDAGQRRHAGAVRRLARGVPRPDGRRTSSRTTWRAAAPSGASCSIAASCTSRRTSAASTARRSTSRATTSACTTTTGGSSATSASSATSPSRCGCRRRSPSTPRELETEVADAHRRAAAQREPRPRHRQRPARSGVRDRRDGRYLEIVTENPRLLFRERPRDAGPDASTTCCRGRRRRSCSLRRRVRKTVETGANQAVEYPLDVQSGSRWFEGRTSLAARRAAATTPHVVFIARDITDRKRADELESQNVYLHEAFDADLHFGEILGRSAAMQQVFQRHRAGRRHRFLGADARRDRHRQGADRARDSPRRAAGGRA